MEFRNFYRLIGRNLVAGPELSLYLTGQIIHGTNWNHESKEIQTWKLNKMRDLVHNELHDKLRVEAASKLQAKFKKFVCLGPDPDIYAIVRVRLTRNLCSFYGTASLRRMVLIDCKRDHYNSESIHNTCTCKLHRLGMTFISLVHRENVLVLIVSWATDMG